jgi:DnaJ-class molecular chaperone
MNDLYATLGIDKSATPEEVKKAYQKLAKKNHPDSPDRDEDRWEEVSKAYEILIDPVRRKTYDETGIYNNDHASLVSETVATLFMRFMGSTEKPIQTAVTYVELENASNREKIAQAKKDIAMITDMVGRISRTDNSEKDPIKSALANKKFELENMIKSATYVISLMEEVIAELKVYRIKPRDEGMTAGNSFESFLTLPKRRFGR